MSETDEKPDAKRMHYVGWPGFIRLAQFGAVCYDAFGSYPYLVGSATQHRNWRDVDVRLLMDDEEYARWFGERTEPQCLNAKWNAMCCAFAEYGSVVTRLPIDFQIDQRTWANEHYKGMRISLAFVGCVPGRNSDLPTAAGREK